jgi:hypothetical protein
MEKKSNKPKTVREIIAQQYQEEAQKSLDRINMSQINTVAKTVGTVLDSLKKPLDQIREVNDRYKVLSSSMFDMPKIKYVRPIEHDVLEVLHEIKDQGAKRKKEVDLFIFNIKEKTLERDTETRSFKYKFIEKGMNFKLIKILIDKEGFRQTRHLKEDLKSKSNEAVRKKVGEINEKIKKGLRLEKDFKFITGEPGAGYKINPDIKIRVIEE